MAQVTPNGYLESTFNFSAYNYLILFDLTFQLLTCPELYISFQFPLAFKTNLTLFVRRKNDKKKPCNTKI